MKSQERQTSVSGLWAGTIVVGLDSCAAVIDSIKQVAQSSLMHVLLVPRDWNTVDWETGLISLDCFTGTSRKVSRWVNRRGMADGLVVLLQV